MPRPTLLLPDSDLPRRFGSRELQFQWLVGEYDRIGGVATGSELAMLVQPHRAQAVSRVARWIVSRRALSFSWQTQALLPLFQFERSTMRLREGMAGVLTELVDVFDEWELAMWFVNPNPWLDDAAPAALLAAEPRQVRDAARVDRFIVRQ